MALTNPAPGQEDAFNAWYDEHHLREVLAYGTGMTGGRRFRLSDAQRPGHTPPWRYLAWYDLEADDLAAFHASPWTTERPPLKPFTGLVAEDFCAWVLSPIGEGIGGFDGCPRGDDFLFMALTNAGPGQDAAFNAWYDVHHLPEIVAALPGFVAGRRYQAPADQRQQTQPIPPWAYVATYGVRANSGAGVHEGASGVRGLTRAPTGALDPDHVAWLWEPVGGYLSR